MPGATLRIVLTLLLLSLTPRAQASQLLGGNAYYFGDLHSHTGYSGDAGSLDLGHCISTTACGSFSDYFDDARANGMDFLATTDHVNGFRALSSADGLVLHAAILAADDPTGGFVTIPAGEIWAYSGPRQVEAIGHKTLLMFQDNTTLAALTLDEVRPGLSPHLTSCEDLWDWADTLSSSYTHLYGGGLTGLDPGAPETYEDGVDSDCDGIEGIAPTSDTEAAADTSGRESGDTASDADAGAEEVTATPTRTIGVGLGGAPGTGSHLWTRPTIRR